MPLDYASTRDARPQIGLRFCLVTLGGAIAGFVLWCALDFVLVRFAPEQIRRFDWLLLLFPFAVGAVAAKILRQPDSSPRAGLAVVAAIVASILALGLILFFGIPFHWVIGGNL